MRSKRSSFAPTRSTSRTSTRANPGGGSACSLKSSRDRSSAKESTPTAKRWKSWPAPSQGAHPKPSFGARGKAQALGHQHPLRQLEQPLHQKRQHRRRNGPLEDQTDVIQADAGEDRLAESPRADQGSQRRGAH